VLVKNSQTQSKISENPHVVNFFDTRCTQQHMLVASCNVPRGGTTTWAGSIILHLQTIKRDAKSIVTPADFNCNFYYRLRYSLSTGLLKQAGVFNTCAVKS